MTNWNANTIRNDPQSDSSKASSSVTPLRDLVTIKHLYTQIHLRHKLKLAQTLVQHAPGCNCIIFCSRKRDKFLLSKYFQKAGISSQLSPDNAGPQPQDNSSIIISSDACQFNIYKGKVAKVIHFDIPPALNTYMTRLGLLTQPSSVSHAIVTQREVPMLQSYHAQLKIDADPQIIDGFEEEPYRPYDGFDD